MLLGIAADYSLGSRQYCDCSNIISLLLLLLTMAKLLPTLRMQRHNLVLLPLLAMSKAPANTASTAT